MRTYPFCEKHVGRWGWAAKPLRSGCQPRALRTLFSAPTFSLRLATFFKVVISQIIASSSRGNRDVRLGTDEIRKGEIRGEIRVR